MSIQNQQCGNVMEYLRNLFLQKNVGVELISIDNPMKPATNQQRALYLRVNRRKFMGNINEMKPLLILKMMLCYGSNEILIPFSNVTTYKYQHRFRNIQWF